MAEELTLKEELGQIVNDAQAKEEITNSDNIVVRDRIMVSVIPVEKYSKRDIRRTLKSDRKRLDREVELSYINKFKLDNQVKNYFRLKASEERKLSIKGILIIIITSIGGISAMLEIMKAIGGI